MNKKIKIWQGGNNLIHRGIPDYLLTTNSQILLLNDGSLTRYLQIFTHSKIEIQVIQISEVKETCSRIPMLVKKLLPHPYIKREICLCEKNGVRLIHATSWWTYSNQGSSCSFLPIWANLNRSRLNVYKDLQNIYLFNDNYLEEMFKQKGPFWGRDYLFWAENKPLTFISESFSPSLISNCVF
uniref:Chorismate lyase n=1 Tax=Glaucocystis incrassata TaxID=1789788 RepID=A0A3G1IV89_9EUKA|nr:chorismate lyase [Glaucocystis incrassata]ASQ39964.1 chorismate lyase [Glaucocystis incrassata]